MSISKTLKSVVEYQSHSRHDKDYSRPTNTKAAPITKTSQIISSPSQKH